MRCGPAITVALIGLGACAVQDGLLADRARTRLLGMGEADLESCVGSPDQHSSFGATDVITYEFTSSSSTSWQLPIIQGPSFSNGGSCRMTVRFDDGVADRIMYSGEKNGTAAPNAYCAPIVRSCLATLDELAREKGRVVGEAAATNAAASRPNATPPP